MEKQDKIIDINDEAQVLELSRQHRNLSIDYDFHRREAARYEYNIDIMIASHMPKFREYRNNIGYETARIMLLEEEGEHKAEIQENYMNYKNHRAKYKGLEVVIQSLQGQISLIQSLIKNRRENA